MEKYYFGSHVSQRTVVLRKNKKNKEEEDKSLQLFIHDSYHSQSALQTTL
jgi:hypothetical protein